MKYLFLFIIGILMAGINSLNAQEQEEEFHNYVFTEPEDAAHYYETDSASRFLPMVSSFGSAGVFYISNPSFQSFIWQFGFGLYILHDIPERYLNRPVADQRAIAFPLYTGFRYDLYEQNSGGIFYTVFAHVLGGPVFGMQSPRSDNFSDQLRATQLRWGLGAQSSLGVEVFFSDNWAGYVQAGVDMLGFTRRLGDRNAYLGPMIGFGIGRVIKR